LTDQTPPVPPAPQSAAPLPPVQRSAWVRWLFLAVVIVGGVGLTFAWWLRSRVEVSTENAYVVGNVTPISPEVAGIVVALYTDDNMIVRAGDPLAKLDPVPYQFEVDRALAELRQARAEAAAAETNVRLVRLDRKSLLVGAAARRGEAEQARRAAEIEVETRHRIHEREQEQLAALKNQLPGLEALVVNARDYLLRFNRLAASGDIPIQDRDNRETAHKEAVAKRDSLSSQIVGAARQVDASELQLQEAKVKLEAASQAVANAGAAVGQAEAAQLQPEIAEATARSLRDKVERAEAALRTARLNLSNTLVRAPRSGVVSRRTIQLGQTLSARQPFLSISPLDLDDVWVVANLREDQMAATRVGQPVVVSLDAIPERSFHGWVESVAGGTGSVFSLFPPDNATGNFVRVVQRLPVRIRFDDKENFENRIRPGMSCRVWIDTTRTVRQGGETGTWP